MAADRKVKYARLQKSLFIPVLGELKELPPANKTIVGLQMTWNEQGLLLKTPKLEVVIPASNVVLADLVIELPTASSGPDKPAA